MDIMCRACLKMHKKIFNIFEYFQSKLISEMLMEHTTIKVQKHDGLPINICSDCLNKLNSASKFKAMVIESDIKLRTFHCNKKEHFYGNEISSTSSIKQEQLFFKIGKSQRFTDLKEEFYSTNSDESVSRSESKSADIDTNLLINKSEKCAESNCSSSCYSSMHVQSTETEDDRNIEQQISLKINCCENRLADDSIHNSLEHNTKMQIYKSENPNGIIFLKDNCNGNSINSPDSSDIECEINMHTDLPMNAGESQAILNDNNGDDDKYCKTLMRKIKIPLSNKEKKRKAVFCKDCNRSFGYRYYFEVHVRHHTGDKPFKCDICGKGFAKRFQLNIHKVVHSDDRPYSCDVCGKGFKSLSSVQNHMVVHSQEKPFKCDQCDKTFKYDNSLKIHILRHQNDRQFICEICGKAFVDRTGLSNHKVAHKEEKNFFCPACGKGFPSKGRMKQHLKQHSDEKPHVCSYCDRGFANKKVMQNHVLIHTGEKPFTCKICNKSFRQSCVLTLHMRTHTGETPYSCELCPCKFKYSHHLQNHMKTHK